MTEAWQLNVMAVSLAVAVALIVEQLWREWREGR